MPSVGWVTTIAPAIQFGFEPIMCESDKETFGLDLDHLEQLLKKHNPSTVIMVQVLGVPHKMEKLLALKEKYGFILLEDGARQWGQVIIIKKSGHSAICPVFLFILVIRFPQLKGGAVSTDNKIFNNILLMLRSHGWGKI